MKNDGLILAVGGTLAALIGSVGVEYAAWGARTMLTTNLIVIVLAAIGWLRRRRG